LIVDGDEGYACVSVLSKYCEDRRTVERCDNNKDGKCMAVFNMDDEWIACIAMDPEFKKPTVEPITEAPKITGKPTASPTLFESQSPTRIPTNIPTKAPIVTKKPSAILCRYLENDIHECAGYPGCWPFISGAGKFRGCRPNVDPPVLTEEQKTMACKDIDDANVCLFREDCNPNLSPNLVVRNCFDKDRLPTPPPTPLPATPAPEDVEMCKGLQERACRKNTMCTVHLKNKLFDYCKARATEGCLGMKKSKCKTEKQCRWMNKACLNLQDGDPCQKLKEKECNEHPNCTPSYKKKKKKFKKCQLSK